MCSEDSHKDGSRPAADVRYEATPDADGAWRVVDLLTGMPAASNGRDFVRLARRDAEDIAQELNACERDGLPSPLL
jgi:hypothetical protein